MKSNPGTAIHAANLLALERKDNEVAVEMFPQRWDILQAIAKSTFTKDKFPETFRLLLEKADELIEFAPMTVSRRELWRADWSVELEDVMGEITHLRLAIDKEKNNLKLNLRLANRLLDILKVGEATTVLQTLKRIDPNNAEVKAIEARMPKN
jgi:predicted Zn-dependent protease